MVKKRQFEEIQLKQHDSWGIFKIMSEFVTGYERLSEIGPCVSVFGSARIQPDSTTTWLPRLPDALLRWALVSSPEAGQGSWKRLTRAPTSREDLRWESI